MRRLRDDQDGAVAVIVAILLVAIFGMAAYAIDVGAIYQERRELQNGADAAAMAAAMDCANPSTAVTCLETHVEFNNRIDEYAHANASDGASNAWIEELNRFDGYITVGTETLSDGNGFLTHFFASVLGRPTSTVRAQATATWGTPGSGASLPLTFSYCEWIDLVPDVDELPSLSETIYFHAGKSAGECSGPAGQDVPGGFGWLDTDESGLCQSTVNSEQKNDGDNGNNVPAACTEEYWADLIGETVLVPIFSSVEGKGSDTQYYIEGFAAFEFEGYRLSGSKYNSDPAPCKGDDRCIRGRFVDYVAYGDHINYGGDDYGAQIVTLTR